MIASGAASEFCYWQGDTISRLVNAMDRAVAPLRRWRLTLSNARKVQLFQPATDGKADNLIVPAGGARYHAPEDTAVAVEDEVGTSARLKIYLWMGQRSLISLSPRSQNLL